MNTIRRDAPSIETCFSTHANERSHQRSVPPMVIDLLMSFGSVSRSHHADVYTFDKRSRRRLAEHVGPEAFRKIERKLNCYVVLSDDGEVITIGRRVRRFRN